MASAFVLWNGGLAVDTYDYGVISLRVPTARGNILVVNDAFDLPALRREIKRECCTCGDILRGRTGRITQLIRDDSELTPHSKETALELVLFYSESKPIHMTADLLGWMMVLPSLGVGLLILIMGLGFPERFLIIMGAAFLAVAAAGFLAIAGLWWCAARERGRLENELVSSVSTTPNGLYGHIRDSTTIVVTSFTA
jgi:hypothetical protein